VTILTETVATAEFISSVANKTRSFETGTLIAGQNLLAGTALGRITASGKLTELDTGASDGSEDIVGVLFDNVNAVADTIVTYVARDAELKAALVLADDAVLAAPEITALAAVGIVLR